MDTIFVNDLRVDTVIGVNDWERKTRQTLSIDLELACDCKKAAASDSIEDTLNYKLVSKRVAAFVEQSEFQLVETLAERIGGLLMDEFGCEWLRVRVNKRGALSAARDVGVVIERGERR
jgi:dihydroneopterin aldolase